tara:strand:+ start:332 stop:631 length:300 start_codon:yes stop_codon:yes gene_type:complete
VELPKTVSIAGKRIKIDVVTLSGDDPDYGMYFHDKKLIQINKGLKDKVMLETLRHEMMEASLLISGVGWLESYDQEAVVRCMEEIFFPAWETFLKRLNP